MARSNCSAFIEQRYAICLIYYGITNLKYPLIHENLYRSEDACYDIVYYEGENSFFLMSKAITEK